MAGYDRAEVSAAPPSLGSWWSLLPTPLSDRFGGGDAEQDGRDGGRVGMNISCGQALRTDSQHRRRVN